MDQQRNVIIGLKDGFRASLTSEGPSAVKAFLDECVLKLVDSSRLALHGIIEASGPKGCFGHAEEHAGVLFVEPA